MMKISFCIRFPLRLLQEFSINNGLSVLTSLDNFLSINTLGILYVFQRYRQFLSYGLGTLRSQAAQIREVLLYMFHLCHAPFL